MTTKWKNSARSAKNGAIDISMTGQYGRFVNLLAWLKVI